jgi:hypothetical protein
VNRDEAADDRVLASGEPAKVAYARLLRRAAGVSVGDWVMSEEQRREVIHDQGRAALVHAAGWDMSAYTELPPCSGARSAVLLAGAGKLGIETEWQGWE